MLEEELLKRLSKFWGKDPNIVVPNGDDTLVIKTSGDKFILLTIDTGLENIHFTQKLLTHREIGYRICAGALSDIAAMGGIPLTILVDLEIPPHTSPECIEHIYEGIQKLQREFNFTIGGGNIVKGDRLRLTITVLGEVEKDYYFTRSSAKEGDILYLTGDIGRVGFFLDNVFGEIELDGELAKLVREKFAHPVPRIKLMRELKNKYRINAAIDISDGLGIDLGRLARMSQVDIYIEASLLPVKPELKKIEMEPEIFFEKIVGSGEEYEIAFTSPQEINHNGISRIGFVKKGTGRVYLNLGEKSIEISQFGYDHLKESDK